MTNLRKSRAISVLIIGVFIGALNSSAFAQVYGSVPKPPIQVEVKDLPKDVVTYIKKMYPHGKIVGAARSAPQPMDEGMRYLFVTVMDGTTKYRLDYYAGRLVGTYKYVLLVKTPGAVSDAVNKRYPGSVIQTTRQINVAQPNGTTFIQYEVDILTARKERLRLDMTEITIPYGKDYKKVQREMQISGETVITDADP